MNFLNITVAYSELEPNFISKAGFVEEVINFKFR